MEQRPRLPYGAWPSPLSIGMAVAASRGLRDPWYDGADLYFVEGRPEDAGRQVLMRRGADGSVTDVTPAPSNVRTRVHEYGGGAYTALDGVALFSNFADGRQYRVKGDGSPEPLTADEPRRFADLRVDPHRDRVLAVVEDHRAGGEPINTIDAVSLADGSVTTLVDGADFFSDPRLDPSGEWLAWLRWDRPNMPWDGTELWIGKLDEGGTISEARKVAGGRDESIVQPTWDRDGSLVFVSDRSGWWNLYRWRVGTSEPQALAPMEAEFADPQWVFGQSSYALLGDGSIVAVARQDGQDRFWRIRETEEPSEIATPYTELSGIRAQGGRVAFIGSAPDQPSAVVELDLASGAMQVVRQTSVLPIDRAYISMPRAIEFPTEGGQTAHAILYPPTNPDVEPIETDRPPLIVLSHGGPTANASTSFQPDIQFFTSRGFAVVDVDYGGSTGYGREYRNRLRDRWGIVDLDDCTNVARWLAAEGEVDGERMAIQGGSAGGYTTLSALAFRDVFACGVSYFGVGDLEALARDTHKFESRYLDLLVAPYPERVDVYRDRSPIHFVGRIDVPVLVLQGADDKVVPQAQADELVAALDERGIPFGYLLFQGEGHGFRRAENLRRSLEAELYFYSRIFGFEPADAIEPVPLEHLETWRAARSAQVASRPR